MTLSHTSSENGPIVLDKLPEVRQTSAFSVVFLTASLFLFFCLFVFCFLTGRVGKGGGGRIGAGAKG